MKIGYLSAFVLSQLYRWFPLVLTPGDRGAAQTFHGQFSWASPPIFTNPILGTHPFASNSLDSWVGCHVRNHVKIAFRVAIDRVQPPERYCL